MTTWGTNPSIWGSDTSSWPCRGSRERSGERLSSLHWRQLLATSSSSLMRSSSMWTTLPVARTAGGPAWMLQMSQWSSRARSQHPSWCWVWSCQKGMWCHLTSSLLASRSTRKSTKRSCRMLWCCGWREWLVAGSTYSSRTLHHHTRPRGCSHGCSGLCHTSGQLMCSPVPPTALTATPVTTTCGGGLSRKLVPPATRMWTLSRLSAAQWPTWTPQRSSLPSGITCRSLMPVGDILNKTCSNMSELTALKVSVLYF